MCIYVKICCILTVQVREKITTICLRRRHPVARAGTAQLAALVYTRPSAYVIGILRSRVSAMETEQRYYRREIARGKLCFSLKSVGEHLRIVISVAHVLFVIFCIRRVHSRFNRQIVVTCYHKRVKVYIISNLIFRNKILQQSIKLQSSETDSLLSLDRHVRHLLPEVAAHNGLRVTAKHAFRCGCKLSMEAQSSAT